MFSKASEYSLRAMMFIVMKTKDGSKVSVKDIAKETETPEPFTAKILQSLSRQGIVSSAKGPNGGFYVSPKNKKIALIDVVKAVDGNNLFVGCGLGLKNCIDSRPCPIHFEYKTIRDQLMDMLKKNTIQDLAGGLMEGDTFLRRG